MPKLFQRLAKSRNGEADSRPLQNGFFSSLFEAIRRSLPLLLALCGSWRFWLGSALAAGAAAISIVIYNEIHADPTDKGNYGYQTLGRERVLLMNVDNYPTCKVTF